MFYIKIYSFILEDPTTTWLEKIVFSQLYNVWEDSGRHLSSELDQTITPQSESDSGVIKIHVNQAFKQLNIHRWNYTHILDSLELKKYITIKAVKGSFTLISIHAGIQAYFETNKIISELKQLWHKK